MLSTIICDTLGIDYPIIQAPMAGVITPQMVAAVGEAGGMGILPGVAVAPEDLRRQIREVREHTRRPFGVNLVLHSVLRPPIDTSSLPESTVHAVQSVLNRFREKLGIPETLDRPPRLPDLLSQAFDVIVEERVAVFSTGLGLPGREMVSRCHQHGIEVMTMVATVPDAREADALGVDLIVAQGAEAGGHRSLGTKPSSPEHASIGTMALLPQVVDAVRAPVLAAGGIMNGRGLVAALALGAQGVLMGTRFIATRESAAPSFHKDALVSADSDATTLSDAFTGHYARFLRNEFTELYRASDAPVFPPVVQQFVTRDIIKAAAELGQADLYPLYSGQGVGMITAIPSAAAVVASAVDEARHAMLDLPRRVRTVAGA